MKRALAVVLFSLLIHPTTFASEPPSVVVSIKPVHSLVANLMQEVGTPGLIVKGDTVAQRYRLTDADRTQIQNADLVIWVGPELEPFLAEAFAAKPDSQKIELLSLEALKILPERGQAERRDPYFWLDTRNALMLLHLLTEALADADPARAHLYRNNHKSIRRDLAELDRKFEYGYRGVSGRPVLIYHDTQQYFEQAYAMRAMGYLAKRVGENADAQLLLQAKETITQAADTICLLTEVGMPDSNLELLADSENTLQAVELDSQGARLAAGPGLYRRLMQHNFDAIQACFRRTK